MKLQPTNQFQRSQYKSYLASQAQIAQKKQMPVFVLHNDDMVDTNNGGWLQKWKLPMPNGRNVWIKLPGEIVNWMGESYAEVLASAICKDFDLYQYTTYYPCIGIYNDQRILACYSYDFCEQNNEKLVTIEKLHNIYNKNSDSFGTEHYRPLLQFIKQKTNCNIQHQLEDMMFLDYLICNFDRSYNNFGLLVKKANNNQYRLAPIFDSGSSFNLCKAGYGEFYRETRYTDGQLPHPFKVTFEEQLKLIRPNRRYTSDFEQFKKVLTWFIMNCSEKNNKYNVVNALSKDRLKHITSMVRKNYGEYKRYKYIA